MLIVIYRLLNSRSVIFLLLNKVIFLYSFVLVNEQSVSSFVAWLRLNWLQKCQLKCSHNITILSFCYIHFIASLLYFLIYVFLQLPHICINMSFSLLFLFYFLGSICFCLDKIRAAALFLCSNDKIFHFCFAFFACRVCTRVISIKANTIV